MKKYFFIVTFLSNAEKKISLMYIQSYYMICCYCFYFTFIEHYKAIATNIFDNILPLSRFNLIFYFIHIEHQSIVFPRRNLKRIFCESSDRCLSNFVLREKLCREEKSIRPYERLPAVWNLIKF